MSEEAFQGSGPIRDHDSGELILTNPPEAKVIMVAESPSPGLMTIYRACRTFDDESARRMIFAAGEPGRLLVRAQHFLREMNDVQEEQKMRQLYKLFRFGHLIYLNPRPGDDRLASQAQEAGRREMDALLNKGVQAIVVFGELGKNWVRTNFPPEGLMIVFLPQPSNHISSWYPSFLERTARERGTDALAVRDAMAVQIDKLVRLCSDL
ncbi:MAG: hypothetical protein SA339_09305 [Methanomassiliicoccus sp.]|nr:hypothetical protein [Methanomassiliicoccus sp.]